MQHTDFNFFSDSRYILFFQEREMKRHQAIIAKEQVSFNNGKIILVIKSKETFNIKNLCSNYQIIFLLHLLLSVEMKLCNSRKGSVNDTILCWLKPLNIKRNRQLVLTRTFKYKVTLIHLKSKV